MAVRAGSFKLQSGRGSGKGSNNDPVKKTNKKTVRSTTTR